MMQFDNNTFYITVYVILGISEDICLLQGGSLLRRETLNC